MTDSLNEPKTRVVLAKDRKVKTHRESLKETRTLLKAAEHHAVKLGRFKEAPMWVGEY